MADDIHQSGLDPLLREHTSPNQNNNKRDGTVLSD
jgi:hypothetical protein